MAKMTPEFQSAFEGFLKNAQEVYDDYIYRNGFDSQREELTYTVGRKYVKVISGHSVHTFIDMTNGDILKPAGYNKPAKHSRGSIFAVDFGKSCMTPHGPNYLR